MQRLGPLTLLPVAASLLGAAAVGVHAHAAGPAATVASITDGDTLRVTGGTRVRLVQIDTPELGGECYARNAARELQRLVLPGTRIGLERDARLDGVDRHGRLLRYVWRGGTNVNLELVRRGAATVYFYGAERGKYAARLLAAARSARAARRGIWGACPVIWEPNGPTTMTPAARPAALAGSGRAGCDPSYPTVCIRPPPPDLDCADVPHRDFLVRPPDPHRFDGRDDDGRGCEG